MARRLKISDRREWYAPKDIEEVYGISRDSLRRMMADAIKEGRPIRTAVVPFQNGSESKRRHPLIRVNKRSFEEYLEFYAD